MKKPCKDCPFRNNLPDHLKGWLGRERAQGIIDSCVEGDEYFQCHKDNSLICAGAILLDLNNNNGEGYANKSTRMLIAFGLLEPEEMRGAEDVFKNSKEFVDFHTNELYDYCIDYDE